MTEIKKANIALGNYILNLELACKFIVYFTLNCVLYIIPLNIVKKIMQMCKHVRQTS